MRQRWPLPMGAMMSSARIDSTSDVVSSFRRSVGSIETCCCSSLRMSVNGASRRSRPCGAGVRSDRPPPRACRCRSRRRACARRRGAVAIAPRGRSVAPNRRGGRLATRLGEPPARSGAARVTVTVPLALRCRWRAAAGALSVTRARIGRAFGTATATAALAAVDALATRARSPRALASPRSPRGRARLRATGARAVRSGRPRGSRLAGRAPRAGRAARWSRGWRTSRGARLTLFGFGAGTDVCRRTRVVRRRSAMRLARRRRGWCRRRSCRCRPGGVACRATAEGGREVVRFTKWTLACSVLEYGY